MRWVLSLLLSAALAFPASAQADATPPPPAIGPNPYLAGARRLYSDLEFEKALEELGRARKFSGSTAAEVVQIEVYTGLIDFNLGQSDAGRSAFEAALALDPKAGLPPRVSPRIEAEWNAIQTRLTQLDRQSPAVVPAPPPPAAPGVATSSVPPPAKPVDLAPASPDVGTNAIQASAPESPVSTYGPYVVLGTAVVAAGLGTAFGLSALGEGHAAQSLSTPQTQVGPDNQAAANDGRAADVLFAVAGAAAVGGVVWLLAR